MTRYLIQGSYTPEGAKGILKQGGTSRYKQIEEMTKSLGGTLESLHWAFGETDFFCLVDLPDPATAAAIGLTISGSGAVRIRTTVLLTAEELDQVKSKTVDYKVPGSSS